MSKRLFNHCDLSEPFTLKTAGCFSCFVYHY